MNIWHYQNLLNIVRGSIQTAAYYLANGELVARKNNDGSKTYYHTDHLGSTSILTNQSGTLVESTTYNPWGKVLAGGTNSRFQYTGKEKDQETGLNYYESRYYSSDIRRFVQPDSMLPNIYDPQQLNRYSYANNNPLKYTDPTGHEIVFKDGKIQSTFFPAPQQKKTTSSNTQNTSTKQNNSNSNPIPGYTSVLGNSTSSNNSGAAQESTRKLEIPPGVDINANMKEAAQHPWTGGIGNILWFKNQVQSGGVWDYKNNDRYGSNADKYQNFGNFNYGAVGQAAGYSEYILLNGGGWAQKEKNKERSEKGQDLVPSQGILFLIYPFEDDPKDSYWIQQGYDYAEGF